MAKPAPHKLSIKGTRGDDSIVFVSDTAYDLNGKLKAVDSAAVLAGVLVDAGAGNDHIIGWAGSDNLTGGDGNDTIQGGAGNDILHGDAGDDSLFGDAGNDTIFGGLGSDNLYGGAGDDQLFGDDGNDALFYQGGTDLLDGGLGNDVLMFANPDGSSNATDAIISDIGAGKFTIKFAGDAGTATVQNIETIIAGDGNYVATASADSLTNLSLGAGDDTFSVLSSHTNLAVRVNGGNGFDTLIGAQVITLNNPYNQMLVPNSNGGGVLIGGFENYIGTDNNDSYDFSQFSPEQSGGVAASTGLGNDTVIGSNFADNIDGGMGNDVLTGSGGSDTLTGGAGADRFIYGPDSVFFAFDNITDFNPNEGDVIDFRPLAQFTGTINYVGSAYDSEIGGTQLTIEDGALHFYNGGPLNPGVVITGGDPFTGTDGLLGVNNIFL